MADQKDAVALLKADHRKVEELFEKYEKKGADKAAIARQICTELVVHAKIEEDVFYPACRGKVEDDLLDESYVEHDGAKLLIAELEAGRPADQFFDAKVTALKEQIEHHVKEEERRLEGLFAQARRAGLDMDELGEKLAEEKARLMASIDPKSPPKPQLATMKVAQVD